MVIFSTHFWQTLNFKEKQHTGTSCATAQDIVGPPKMDHWKMKHCLVKVGNEGSSTFQKRIIKLSSQQPASRGRRMAGPFWSFTCRSKRLHADFGWKMHTLKYSNPWLTRIGSDWGLSPGLLWWKVITTWAALSGSPKLWHLCFFFWESCNYIW